MKYAILGIRHSLDKTTATPESVEELKKFSEGGRGIMDERFMMPLGRDFRGTIMTGKPGCFWAINLSKKHVDVRTTLSGFCASTQLPSSIIEPLKALDAAVDDNVNLILATINEHLALDKRFVLEADTITSPYVGKITTKSSSPFYPPATQSRTTSPPQSENTSVCLKHRGKTGQPELRDFLEPARSLPTNALATADALSPRALDAEDTAKVENRWRTSVYPCRAPRGKVRRRGKAAAAREVRVPACGPWTVRAIDAADAARTSRHNAPGSFILLRRRSTANDRSAANDKILPRSPRTPARCVQARPLLRWQHCGLVWHRGRAAAASAFATQAGITSANPHLRNALVLELGRRSKNSPHYA